MSERPFVTRNYVFMPQRPHFFKHNLKFMGCDPKQTVKCFRIFADFRVPYAHGGSLLSVSPHTFYTYFPKIDTYAAGLIMNECKFFLVIISEWFVRGIV